MEVNDLGKEIAIGLLNTGVEGGYGSVSCSTAGDYPSMGCQQIEGIGGRGDELLNSITGGDHYVGRSYSDIEAAGELSFLAALLDSEEGQKAQMTILQHDTISYAQACIDAGLTDARCVIYAGMWCPTSQYIVGLFIQHRIERGYEIAANLETLNQTFYDEYADAADCSSYAESYQNRAQSTYSYVSSLDLSAYGI